MTLSTLLLKEKVVDVSQLRRHPERLLHGFVRVVSKGQRLRTNGFFLDPDTFESLMESLEYASPEFWERIEKSRRSGRVSGKEIEKHLGIKS